MRKYGIEHFHIELIEETDNPEEREIYWIEQKRSFKNGYNATMGGDGKKYLDYDLIIAVYNQVHNIIDTANLMNCSVDAVSSILKENNCKVFSPSEVNREKYGVTVNQYSLQNDYIQSFPSYKAAAAAIGKEHSNGAASHIADACKGKRRIAYGYIWKFE